MNKVPEALRKTWEAKEAFYEKNKGLSIHEVLEKLEGKKFPRKSKKAA